MTEGEARTKVLVLLGPTASGKTAYALELAEALGGEVVSQDSRQVYRSMDIGTAKPTPEDRARAPHHGLDRVAPDETWTLAQQQRLTYDAVRGIAARGRLPMLVGGTGQYLRAALEGWTIPEVAPNAELRETLSAEAEAVGAPALPARLAEADPQAAAKIMPTDLRRIIRGLEVLAETGRPLSEQQRAAPPPWDALLLGLSMPREALYERIDRRADAMLRAGLLAEIAGLLAAGYDWSLPSMKTIGYGEFRPFFEGAASVAACAERLRYDTHRFVRHQDVWFRRFEAVRRLDPRHRAELEEGLRFSGAWLRGG